MNVKLVVSNAGNRTNELRNERKRRRSEARLRDTDAASEPRSPRNRSGTLGDGESSAERASNAASPPVANMPPAVCSATPPAPRPVLSQTRGRAMGWKLSYGLHLCKCSLP